MARGLFSGERSTTETTGVDTTRVGRRGMNEYGRGGLYGRRKGLRHLGSGPGERSFGWPWRDRRLTDTGRIVVTQESLEVGGPQEFR